MSGRSTKRGGCTSADTITHRPARCPRTDTEAGKVPIITSRAAIPKETAGPVFITPAASARRVSTTNMTLPRTGRNRSTA